MSPISMIELFHYCSLIIVESMVQSQKGILTEDFSSINSINPLLKNSSTISNRESLNKSKKRNDTARECYEWTLTPKNYFFSHFFYQFYKQSKLSIHSNIDCQRFLRVWIWIYNIQKLLRPFPPLLIEFYSLSYPPAIGL